MTGLGGNEELSDDERAEIAVESGELSFAHRIVIAVWCVAIVGALACWMAEVL